MGSAGNETFERSRRHADDRARRPETHGEMCLHVIGKLAAGRNGSGK
jgi:hypothetical protein